MRVRFDRGLPILGLVAVFALAWSNQDGAGFVRLTTDPGIEMGPVWSPDSSSILFCWDGLGKVGPQIVPSTGGVASHIDLGGVSVDLATWSASWSPTGERVAFSGVVDGNNDIWIVDLNSGKLSRVTTDPEVDQWPSWSPDARAIAFASNRSGNWDLWTVPSNGGAATRITRNVFDDREPCWSPDGTAIAFTSGRRHERICVIPTTSGRTEWYIGAMDVVTSPTWSPDNSMIAYSSDRGGSYNIWIETLGTAQRCQITSGCALDTRPSWSPDGSRVAFTSDREGSQDIWVANLETLEAMRALHTPGAHDGSGGQDALRGRVVDTWTRRPVSLFRVFLVPAEGDVIREHASSHPDRDLGWRDPRGEFCVSGLKPGSYDMIVQARGYLDRIIEEVQVPSVDRIVVRLERGACIEGHVVSSDGDAVPAAVRLNQKRPFLSEGTPRLQRTDSEGYFLFSLLHPGIYTLGVGKDNTHETEEIKVVEGQRVVHDIVVPMK